MKTQDLKQMEPTKTRWIVLLFILALGLFFAKLAMVKEAENKAKYETNKLK